MPQEANKFLGAFLRLEILKKILVLKTISSYTGLRRFTMKQKLVKIQELAIRLQRIQARLDSRLAAGEWTDEEQDAQSSDEWLFRKYAEELKILVASI